MTKSTNSVSGGAMPRSDRITVITRNRRDFIGGSDAQIIMGNEKALLRLWREKRGEETAPDMSAVLIVQLGLVTEVVPDAELMPAARKWAERLADGGGHGGGRR